MLSKKLLGAPFAICGLLVGCTSAGVSENSRDGFSRSDYTVQLIGTATVLIEYGDQRIITDPALDPAGGTYDNGFAILEKVESPATPAASVPAVDIVLLSHDQHSDNLDTAGNAFVINAPLTLTTNDGAARLGGNAVGLEPWEVFRVNDMEIMAVPAQHGPAQAVPVLGTVVGFVISSQNGPTIYISGDTVPFEGTDELVERFAGTIDHALIHTGAVAQGEEDELTFFTMTASDAVQLSEQLEVPAFSIIHADSWKHFRQPMQDAIEIVRNSSLSGRFLDLSDNQRKSLR